MMALRILHLTCITSLFYCYVQGSRSAVLPTNPYLKDSEDRNLLPVQMVQHQGLKSFEPQLHQLPLWYSQAIPVIQPITNFEVPARGVIGHPETNTRRRCPLSPFAQFLTDGEQEALHELIVEARQNGADEPEIKEHINKYLKEILTPEKLTQFEEANARFERNRLATRLNNGISDQLSKSGAKKTNLLEQNNWNETNASRKLSNLFLKMH